MNGDYVTGPEQATPAAFDAIVVGTGLAGLAAAVTLIDAGRRVLVVEKELVPGGSTAMSGGWFAFSGTTEQDRDGVEDSDALFLEDMLANAGGKADASLLTAYLHHQADAYRWIKGLVPTFGVLKVSSGQSVARSHHVDIDRLMHHFQERLAAADRATVLLGHRLVSLLTDSTGEAVTGVQTQSEHGAQRFLSGGGVVLATGGFSRSQDLLEIFAPDQLAGIPYGGIGNTGDGLKAAWRLGAGVRDLGYVSGTYGSHPETGDEEHELLTAFYMGAVIVNQRGERFIDESESYKTLGSACLKQPGGLGYQIFDATVRAKSQPGVPLSDIDHLEGKGRLLKAGTLAELAALIDVDGDTLVTTIERYNDAVAGNGVDPWGRTGLCNGVGDLLPVQSAPFYAYPAKTLMTSTYAGLTVTPRAEVLRIDGTLIPGLYAAGEVCGGFHGTAYMTGTALSKALIFGRMAANQIDALLPEEPAH